MILRDYSIDRAGFEPLDLGRSITARFRCIQVLAVICLVLDPSEHLVNCYDPGDVDVDLALGSILNDTREVLAQDPS